MNDRKKFLLKLAELEPTRLDQAVFLLWYYEQFQQYTERSVNDLAKDIQDDGFGLQNISRLRNQLSKSKLTVRGTRRETFRINSAHFQKLTEKYGPMVNVVEIKVTSSVIPLEFVAGTRTYLERMVNQINGSYDSGFFDASSVILRRLMETLIIEVYVKNDRLSEIKNNNITLSLSDLISTMTNDQKINKSRNFNRGANLIKDLGDTAAHDRTYITPKQDIDDNKTQVRKTIHELLVLSGIAK